MKGFAPWILVVQESDEQDGLLAPKSLEQSTHVRAFGQIDRLVAAVGPDPAGGLGPAETTARQCTKSAAGGSTPIPERASLRGLSSLPTSRVWTSAFPRRDRAHRSCSCGTDSLTSPSYSGDLAGVAPGIWGVESDPVESNHHPARHSQGEHIIDRSDP